MAEIKFVRGDASKPHGEGAVPITIAHIVNDRGAWGAGFVIAVSRRWPKARESYIRWSKGQGALGETVLMPPGGDSFALGSVQFLVPEQGENPVYLANMCAQHGVGPGPQGPPIRYDALRTCLEAVAAHALENDCEVHMPFVGCGLAGGNWGEIGPIIEETLVDQGVNVVVYDFTGEYSEITGL